MERIASFMLFFAVFLFIYLSANYYVYLKLSKVLRIRNKSFLIIFFLLTLSFIAVSITERNISTPITNAVYTICAFWVGFIFLILISFLVIDIMNFFLKLSGININYTQIEIAAISIIIVLSVYSVYNSLNIRVSQIELTSKKLPDRGITVAQLSDIHLGSIHGQKFLKEIVGITNSLDPDIVVITGDLFDGSSKISSDLIGPISGLKPKYGTYFVTGNHETYLGADEIEDMVRSKNITVLRNNIEKVGGIQVIGIDYLDREFSKDNSVLRELCKLVKKDIFSLLLYHPPSGIQEAENCGIDLQLSGHTHNGQIWPFNLFLLPFFGYAHGLYKLGDTYIYTSAGVGTWGPPMRLLANPEIVYFRITNSG